MPKGLQHKGIIRRNKMLYAAVQLFLENGYEKTTTASIAKAAGMAPSSFFAAFENKEALLLTLVKTMFGSQFENTGAILGENADPLLLYGVETALQMYIAEMSESLRELYVVGYSLPTTSEYIYLHTTYELKQIFGKNFPDYDDSDFYEMEIGTAGLMRGYMARKCDIHFPLERKLRRFLVAEMRVYQVPETEQEKVLQFIQSLDIKAIATDVMYKLFAMLEMTFDFKLSKDS